MPGEYPFAFQTYQSEVLPFSAQRMVNLFSELPVEGAKTRMLVQGTPGQVGYVEVGSGPIRGMHTMGGDLYVVSGPDVFKIDEFAIATNLGSIGDSGAVVMDDNGTQVAIASAKKGWIITSTTVTQITDVNFREPDSVTYMDTFFVWNDGPIMQSSAPLDGLSYDGLDIAAADYDPDTALRVFRDHDQLFVFGQDSIEIWYNAGLSAFPFAPIEGASMETGLLAKNSVAKVDNSVYWLGSDDRGGITVQRAVEYRPVRISTHAIEKKLEEASNLSDARGFSYRETGHAFYVLTLPGQFTFVYDAATQLWHERESFGQNSWRPQTYARHAGKHLVGDSLTGRINELRMDVFDDQTTTIERHAVSPTFQVGNELVRHTFFRVDFESGVGLTSGQGSDPQAMLSWSDDGARTFNNEKFRSIGKIGEYLHRTFWRRLGRARVRTYKLRITDPVKVAIMGAYTNFEPGKW